MGQLREHAIGSPLTRPSRLSADDTAIETWRAALLALLIVLCLAVVTTLGSPQRDGPLTPPATRTG